eukprot:gene15596-18528_t
MTDAITSLINNAAVAKSDVERTDLLSSAFELLFFQDTQLLAEFYPNLIHKLRPVFLKQTVPLLCQAPTRVPRFQTVQNESIKHTLKTSLISILKLKNQLVAPFITELVEALTVVDAKEAAEDAARWYKGEPEKKKRQHEQTSESTNKKQKQPSQQTPPMDEFRQNNNNNNMPAMMDYNGQQQQPNVQPTRTISYRPGLHLDVETQNMIISTIATLSPDFVADLVMENMGVAPLFYLLQTIPNNPNTENIFRFEQPELEEELVLPADDTPAGLDEAMPLVKFEMNQPTEMTPSSTPKPVFNMASLELSAPATIVSHSLVRVRVSELGAIRAGKGLLWSSLFARLLSYSPTTDRDTLIHTTIDFILEAFPARRELALQWLQNELQNELQRANGDLENGPYSSLLLQVVRRVSKHFVEDDARAISLFILEVPLVTGGLLAHIRECCTRDDTANVSLGLNTLRDLTLLRPNVREPCLNTLLEFSVHERPSVRATSISILAEQLFSKPSLESRIQQYATTQLLSLLESHKAVIVVKKENGTEDSLETPPPVDSELSVVNKSNEVSIIEQKIQIFFALCAKRPALLSELLEFYSRTPSDIVKSELVSRIGPVARAIGMQNDALLQTVRMCPVGAESLMFEMLNSVVGSDRPTADFVAAVKTLLLTSDTPRFYLPIIAGLTKEDIVALLPTIVVQPKEEMAKFITALAQPNASISPSELLVHLHLTAAPSPKHIADSIDSCLEHVGVFRQETLAVAIVQLQGEATLPSTLVRTMILALKRFPMLKQFIIEQLRALVSKQIWNDANLWKGFLMCASSAEPDSFPVVLDLPASQFENAMASSNGLKDRLKIFLSKKNQQTLSQFPKNNLKFLGITTNKKTT